MVKTEILTPQQFTDVHNIYQNSISICIKPYY